MEIKKFNIDGKEIEFVNESLDTRHGFKHVTTMFINNCEYGRNTCYYLNRTWERYRYQTVMRGCVQNLIEIRIENSVSDSDSESIDFSTIMDDEDDDLDWLKELA